jgi:hypothetical protein
MAFHEHLARIRSLALEQLSFHLLLFFKLGFRDGQVAMMRP